MYMVLVSTRTSL